MDVSVNWLRELAPGLEGSPEELADRLSMRAVPVDGVRRVGKGLDGIVAARVLEVRPHPNADRLLLCRIDPGSGEEVELVCGAPVVEQGALYPWVRPGAVLPGGMKIEARKIRGVTSHGMLCSERELEIGRDASGIWKLPPDVAPGGELAGALGLPDALLRLDLTPNRVDLACHAGVARELAPGGASDLRLRELGSGWEPAWRDDAEASEAAGVRVRIEDRERCPRYLGAVIRGVEIGPSPAWLVGRLRAIGVRPVNNVVDATNYVLMELNQPLHAFDLDRIRGGEVRVRAAEPGEGLRTLDGRERELRATATVIADAEGPVALAGVMGGEESEVGEETTDVFLECAAFHPLHTRHTARSAGLATEASYRFERGIDERGLERALERCVRLVLALAGGDAEPEAARVGRPPPPRLEVGLRRRRVARVLGIEPDEFELRRLLEPLGFELPDEPSPGEHRVLVPGWRPDVTREIDLVEEVARRHGYEAFPDEPRSFRPSGVPDDPAWARIERVRGLMTGRGFLEARSSSFVPPDQPGGRSRVELLNPLSEEESHLRAELVPVLLRRVEHNWTRGRRDVRLFEVGTVFGLGAGGETGYDRFREESRVAAVLSGLREPPHWTRAEEDADLWDLKGLAAEVAGSLCEAELEPLGPAGGRGEPAEDPPAEPGWDWLGAEGFRIVRKGREIGRAGAVHPGALDAPPWAARVWALEFRLEAVRPAREAAYAAVPPYPAVRRDLAVSVPKSVAAARLDDRIRASAPDTLESAELFDLYEGEGVESGRRSLAWSFRFRAPDRTLTDEEVDEAMRRIVAALEEECDARVRTA